LEFALELLFAFAGEAVVFGGAAEVGVLPFGGDPALIFEAVEGGIEGTLADGEDFTGEDLDALGDAPTVEGLAGDGFEDEKVESALEEVGWLGHEDTSNIDNIPRLSTMRQEAERKHG
jgi:hypothetical protein